HVREVHAREAEPLAAGQDRREHDRAREAPNEPAPPVHGRASEWASRVGLASTARARSSSASAAPIRPRCVNACGKLPSGAPVSPSISSANNPRSLAYCSVASKRERASSREPPPAARNSAAQKQQIPKAPSLAARLCSYR